MSRPGKETLSLVSAHTPSDGGKSLAKSKPSAPHPGGLADTISTPMLTPPSLSSPPPTPLSSTPESLPDSKKKTLIAKLQLLLVSTRAAKSSQTSVQDSTSNAKDSQPFWNELSAVLSELLWLPTLTDSADFGLANCNGSVSGLTAASWFSSKSISAQSKNWLKISCPRSTFSAVGFTDGFSTKPKSKKTQKYKSTPRHDHSKKNPPPNLAIKIRVYPDKQLHQVWKRWLAACRFVCNRALALLKQGATFGSGYELKRVGMGSDLPGWVKSTPCHIRQNAILDAWDAYAQAKKIRERHYFAVVARPVRPSSLMLATSPRDAGIPD